MSINRYFTVLASLIGDKEGVYIPSILINHFKCYLSAAVFKQLIFWSDKGKRNDGYFYKTSQDLADELYLSKHQIDRIIKKLVDSGLVE